MIICKSVPLVLINPLSKHTLQKNLYLEYCVSFIEKATQMLLLKKSRSHIRRRKEKEKEKRRKSPINHIPKIILTNQFAVMMMVTTNQL